MTTTIYIDNLYMSGFYDGYLANDCSDSKLWEATLDKALKDDYLIDENYKYTNQFRSMRDYFKGDSNAI